MSRILMLVALLFASDLHAGQAPATNLFTTGTGGYRSGHYRESAEIFRELNTQQLSSGALQNLGNAEWQIGHPGHAILAWEQALWLNPFDHNARNNLRFARDAAQLEAPDLAWYEVASGWLPAWGWAWLTGFSLWIAVGALVLPGFLRWRKAAWHQALATVSLGVFLLCIPAHVGTLTRANLGFVLEKETPLRLTPTTDGEVVTRLAAGEPARRVRSRGEFVFVRMRTSAGWIQQEQFGLICAKAPASAGLRR